MFLPIGKIFFALGEKAFFPKVKVGEDTTPCSECFATGVLFSVFTRNTPYISKKEGVGEMGVPFLWNRKFKIIRNQ